jgi:hypothetical protein
MKTLSIVVALVALVAVGAVGGFDYATHCRIGILPSSWTNCCQGCCEDQSDCCLKASSSLPSAESASESDFSCPACAAAAAEKVKCCDDAADQTTAVQTPEK